MSYRVGVLGLQGGFKELLAALARYNSLGVVAVDVRTPEELESVDALIIPGGESTTIGKCIEYALLKEPLRVFVKEHNKPVWGVCAGTILLAESLENTSKAIQQQETLIGGLNATVSRNYFGRQRNSAFRSIQITSAAAKDTSVKLNDRSHFIRAPAIIKTDNSTTVLAKVADIVVAARTNNVLATCFHPEISSDDSWLQYFLTHKSLCGIALSAMPKITIPHPSTVAPWVEPSKHFSSPVPISVKRAFMVFQQGGVIMDVVTAAQARVAEAAGAVSVMALERIPADIKKDGGIARMSDPILIKEIMAATTLPVMAKARIGHFAEAHVLDSLDVDCIDESEVLTIADELHHIDKHQFAVPFVCGAKDLGEALRRISEGAAMIRLKGNAGTGNVLHAVRHARSVFSEIRALSAMRPDELHVFAKQHGVPISLVRQVHAIGRLPVVTFAAGGIATPADVALMMHLGCDGVFVGSGIFKGDNPEKRARAIVQACAHYKDAGVVARVSENLGKAMVGILDNGESYALAGTNFDSKL